MSWRKRLLIAAGAALGVSIVAVAGLAAGGWYFVHSPELICRTAEWGLDWPDKSIQIEELEINWDRSFVLGGVEVHPPAARAPDIRIARVAATLPSPLSAWYREINFGDLAADGVQISARMQRPPDSRPEPPEFPMRIVASSLKLTNGQFSAPEDPPFKPILVEGVDAHLNGVRWTPVARQIEGYGTANIAHMQLGSIDLTQVDLPTVVLTGSDLTLGNSTFRYGRTEGSAEGTISHIDGRPAIEITVGLTGNRIETAVEDAMGRQSPVMGWLSLEMTIFAGGELERGDSRIKGWLELSDAYVFVGNSLKIIPKVLLDVAPWFQREDGGWLAVGNLRGEAIFGRGWVELERMERSSNKNRILQAWGALRDGQVDITVRVIPKKKPENPGLGVRVRGPLQSAKIKLAKKQDLIVAPEVIVVE